MGSIIAVNRPACCEIRHRHFMLREHRQTAAWVDTLDAADKCQRFHVRQRQIAHQFPVFVGNPHKFAAHPHAHAFALQHHMHAIIAIRP